jgi:hypothetical protein
MLDIEQTIGRRSAYIGTPRGAPSERWQVCAECSPTDRVKGRAMSLAVSDPVTNRLLASLSHIDLSQLRPLLRFETLKQGIVLHDPGDEVEYIYFPHYGMISLLAVMKDGRAIETATIGSESAVGIMAGIGLHKALTRAVVQLPLAVSKISSVAFRKVVRSSDLLRNLVVRANDALLAQVQITAAMRCIPLRHDYRAGFCSRAIG